MAILATASTLAVGLALAQADDPRDVGLVERAGTRLVQLDVSVRGPERVVAELDAEHFELRVGGRRIDSFVVDRVCRDPVPAGTEPAEPPVDGREEDAVARAIAESIAPVTYVFYLDQPLMTMAGRQQAIDGLRELIPRLFESSRAQAMLIYNGRDLETVVDMTSDVEALLAGLDRVESERRNWDPYAMSEGRRIGEVIDTQERIDVDFALNRARLFQQEEAWYVEKALRRVSIVLGRLADYEQPKAFLYYADILRRNAGAHYVSMFPNSMLMPTEQGGQASIMETSASLTAVSFDRLLDDASALGVRFYTVQAEGLMADTTLFQRSPEMSGAAVGTVRIRDAQDTLDSLGLETGGRSFLNGVPPQKMAKELAEDLRCMFLVSFDPGDLPQDEPLPVRLTTDVPKVDLQVRGRLVIQSETERRRSRLLAAFATAGSDEGSGASAAIRGRVVPTDFDGKRWSALVQVWVPGTEVRTASWDIGASLIGKGKVREDFSSRIRPTAVGARVVIERETTFPPGPFELVAVAHEQSTDQLFSRKIEGEWPDPDDADAVIAPIAVLQPEVGAFVRDDTVRTSGALALGPDDPVQTDRPTALVTVVCRTGRRVGELTVERTLSGENRVPFDAFVLPSAERCTQVRDGIPRGAMGEGELVYRVRVLLGEKEIVSRETRLLAVAPGTTAAALAPDRPTETR